MKSNVEGVIIISISVNKCCSHDTIAISSIFKMAAAAILDFEKTAIVGAWHHLDLIRRGSEDSKTVLTSNTCFFKGVKVKIATIPPDYNIKVSLLCCDVLSSTIQRLINVKKQCQCCLTSSVALHAGNSIYSCSFVSVYVDGEFRSHIRERKRE